MRFRRYRSASIAFLVAALSVVGVQFLVDSMTREPPNYSRIEGGLWLGGLVPEPPLKTSAVLNLCESQDPYLAAVHRWEPIRDAEPAPSLEWLREQVDWIAAQRATGRVVYVHCRNGVSRSAMVVAAYLMRREGWKRDRALEYLRERRPGMRPNPAFLRLLSAWEVPSEGSNEAR